MTLEKDKVYKVQHNYSDFDEDYPRDYLLICPAENLVLSDDFFKKSTYHFLSNDNSSKDLACKFIVCFNGWHEFNHATSIHESCSLLQLNNNDLEEIKTVVSELGEKYKYNRKLNKIVYESNK